MRRLASFLCLCLLVVLSGFSAIAGDVTLLAGADCTQTTSTASTVGAINGDVTLLAGADYTQTGSHVLAPGGDISVLAQNIAIQEARETYQSETDTWFKQSGLTVSLSSPILSALQTGSQMVQAAQNTSNTRMQALAAASLGLAGYEAYTLIDKALTSDNPTKALAPTLNISKRSPQGLVGRKSAAPSVGWIPATMPIVRQPADNETFVLNDRKQRIITSQRCSIRKYGRCSLKNRV